jgi:hypothetical protein
MNEAMCKEEENLPIAMLFDALKVQVIGERKR